MKERERVRALEALGAAERARLAWAVAAHPAQRAPRACADGGDWTTWLFLGGRGAGKTRAGAEWVWEVAEALGARGLGSGARIALVGATMHDVRSVMVEGPSGLMNLPFRSGLRFEPSLRRVVFPGGAVGMLFSAEEPERLRGPQFHAAWGDELCAWGRGAETLANLRLGLRLGADARDAVARCLSAGLGADARDAVARCLSAGLGADARDTVARCLSAGLGADARLAEPRCMSAGDPLNLREETAGWTPRLMLTTTPKPTRVLRTLLAEPGLVRTDAPTGANAANLAPGFLATMQALYGGTRRAAQELEGRVLEAGGTLFRLEDIERAKRLGGGCRPSGGLSPGMEAAPADPFRGPCDRVVVAVDPPAGTLSGRPRDACGIVAAGCVGRGPSRRAVVLEDRTIRGLSPEGWARRVKATVETHGASLVVVEANQGGAMAEAVLRAAGPGAPVKRVHTVLGKAARAEPVAALYEQGRVAHAAGLEALEEELMALGTGGEDRGRSPDRADALVWAITELMLGRGDGPRVRAF
jgi:phage terminase large subunit-like protein